MVNIAGYEVTVNACPGSEEAAKLLLEWLKKNRDTFTVEFTKRERNMIIYGTTHPERLNCGDFING